MSPSIASPPLPLPDRANNHANGEDHPSDEENDGDYQPASAVPLERPLASDPSDPSSDDDDDDDNNNNKKAAAHASVASAHLVAKRRAVDDEQADIDEDEVEAARQEREQLIREAGGEDRLGKRRRKTANSGRNDEAATHQDAETEAKVKAAADLAWEQMKASSSTPSSSSTPGPPATPAPTASPVDSTAPAGATSTNGQDLIKVPQTYKFAGETTVVEKLLPRSHPDAIAYLTSLSPPTSTVPVSKPSQPAGAGATRPGWRRKKSSSLASLSAAATAKPVKLNTLEKSKMDWDTYKNSPTHGLTEAERDEIEAQTRGGASGLGSMKGYLERRDFLDRVDQRVQRGDGAGKR
ncbi:hypothetical protein ACQY0O_002528 [Thecaphora frezii]